MNCPKCGLEQPEAAECARCGLVIAKWKLPAAPTLRDAPAPDEPTSAGTDAATPFGVTERPPEGGAAAMFYGCGALAVIVAGLFYGLHRNWPALSRRWLPPPTAAAPPAVPPPRPVTVSLPRPAGNAPPPAKPLPPPAFRPVPGSPLQSSFEMLLDVTTLPPAPAGRVAAEWRDGAAGYADAVQDHFQAEAPLFIFFYTDWCPHCKAVQETLWSDPLVDAALQSVARVRINPEQGDDDRTIYRQFGVKGIPTCFFVPARSTQAMQFPCYNGMTAKEFIARLAAESGGQEKNLVEAGALKTRRKENREAIQLLNQALSFNPRHRDAYLWRGKAKAQAGEQAAAQSDLLRAIKLDPHQFEGYHELHEVWLKDRRLDDMIALWDYFLRLEPRHGWGYLQRSGTWGFMGDKTRALEDARKSCDLGEAHGCTVAGLLAGRK